MEKAEFIAGWTQRSGMIKTDEGAATADGKLVRVAVECDCGEEDCDGWAMIPTVQNFTTWQVGDVLVSKDGEVQREITEVRPTGYQWRYPEFGDKTAIGRDNSFMSEDSNDEALMFGWSKAPD